MKMSLARKGIPHTEEWKQKMRGKTPWNKGTKGLCKPNKGSFYKGIIPWNKGKKLPTGENAYNWKGGIEFRKKTDERNDSKYQEWVRLVKKRDDNQCAFKGQNCSGYNIVHHILSWTKFPELRYNINNGITLCQYHHPLKRDDEQRLIPIFQELVGSKEII